MYAERIKKGVMSLGYAWLDSITFLWSDKVKLTLLGTYRALIDSYKILIVKFWWILIPVAFSFPVPREIGLLFLIALTTLAVRPSVGKKKYAYFIHFWRFFVFYFFVVFFFSSFVYFIPMPWAWRFYVWLIAPLFWYILFFASDAYYSYRAMAQSVWCAMKMVFYNYPLILLILGVFSIFELYLELFLDLFSDKAYSNLIEFFTIPLSASILNSLYIQRRHDQRDLYQEG